MKKLYKNRLTNKITAFSLLGCFLSFLFFFSNSAFSQTDIHISGPQGGFPVAVPGLCLPLGEGGEMPLISKNITERIGKNINLSGLFNLLDSRKYIEGAQSCADAKELAYSDWSLIGAEGVIRGAVTGRKGDLFTVDMYLFDVLQQKAVIGKRYEASLDELNKISDRFTNLVIKYFTGESGIFGSQIVYVSRVGRFKELFIMDIDGSNNKKITRDRGLALTPSWSHSADKIVYTSYRTRSPELFYVSPKGGEPRQISKLAGLEIGAEFAKGDNQLVVSSSQGGSPNIVLMNLRGKIVRHITKSSSIDVSPSYSPEGSRITFCSNRGGSPQVYIASSGTGSLGSAKRLSFTGSKYCTSPSWSPKGDKIAYVCRNRGSQIYVTSVDGSSTSQLTYSGSNEDPSWSPDGRYLIFSSDFGKGGARNIAFMPVDTARPTQISFSSSEESQPSWSPVLE